MTARGKRILVAALSMSWGWACGSSDSTQGTSDASPGECPAGQIRCSTCGSFFCGAACPNIACVTKVDSGTLADSGTPVDGSAGADASAGGCPAQTPTSCTDCGGQTFCVARSCPGFSCPNVDAAASQCPQPMPSNGQTCTEPQGCSYGSTCAFCAPSHVGVAAFDCASQGCAWGSMQPPPNDAACPTTPPRDHDSCGNYRTCYYCTDQGLLRADCSSAADNFTWSVGPLQHETQGAADASGGDSSTSAHAFACGSLNCDAATEFCSITNGHLPGQAATYECVTSDGGAPSCGGPNSAASPGNCGCYESSQGEVTKTLCPP
jgi:hypothetical protein